MLPSAIFKLVYFNDIDPNAVRVELYADRINSSSPVRQEIMLIGGSRMKNKNKTQKTKGARYYAKQSQNTKGLQVGERHSC
jgi:hypothetical protein